MFIFIHKKVDIITPDRYLTLLLGAEQKKNITCYENRDNEGENISDKNKNYCELTGIYWIWKNISANIVGCCHYRRYFTNANYSTDSQFFLKLTDIERIMKKYDVIVPVPKYYKKSIIESVNIAPNKKDMEEIEKAIRIVSPDYLSSYYEFISGNKTYLYNMCIMKKKYFDSYCEWLFPILFYIEKDYDISKEDAYRSRLFGFLSERLLTVWIKRNIASDKVKEIRVIKTDESAFRNKLHEIKNYYVKMIQR